MRARTCLRVCAYKYRVGSMCVCVTLPRPSPGCESCCVFVKNPPPPPEHTPHRTTTRITALGSWHRSAHTGKSAVLRSIASGVSSAPVVRREPPSRRPSASRLGQNSYLSTSTLTSTPQGSDEEMGDSKWAKLAPLFASRHALFVYV